MQPFNLEAPTKSLFTAMFEPHPCRVCGRTRPGLSPLGARANAHAHSSCDRLEQSWDAAAEKIRGEDEAMQAAELAVTDAEIERDRVYLERMLAAGIPDWFAKQRVDLDFYEP
jgi:hypothetical protein